MYETGIQIYAINTVMKESIYNIKNYIGFNNREGMVITGSANFTSGGLLRNIEASTIASLNLDDVNRG